MKEATREKIIHGCSTGVGLTASYTVGYLIGKTIRDDVVKGNLGLLVVSLIGSFGIGGVVYDSVAKGLDAVLSELVEK